MDETYIKVKGEWKYLYRAVDSDGDTIDFMLSAKRNRKAAKHFFKKALSSNHNQMPRVITVDKNPDYPVAIHELKNEKKLSKSVEIRQVKYLNNIIEQDHRSIKRIIAQMLGFQDFYSASETSKGIEALNMVKKDKSRIETTLILMKLNISINYLKLFYNIGTFFLGYFDFCSSSIDLHTYSDIFATESF